MRCNSRHQNSVVNQCHTSSQIYNMTGFWQSIARETQIVSVVVLLGLGGVFWVTSVALTPHIAQAYTDRIELSLDRRPNETYETLVGRAEAAARRVAQASFEKDTNVTDVSVIIVAQNQGAIAPILSLKVSRPQWLRQPDAQHWATYFSNAQLLLKFKNLATSPSSQPDTQNISTPDQSIPNPDQLGGSPATAPGQPTNPNPDQPGNGSPATAPGQPINPNPDQPGNIYPNTTPRLTNPNTSQPGTGYPITTPSQTTNPSGSIVPQPPVIAPVTPLGNPQTPPPPSRGGSGVRLNTIPGTVAPSSIPFRAPTNSGTINNNPAPNTRREY